jgi:oxygen-dependent protoporphyrinogen oxidase
VGGGISGLSAAYELERRGIAYRLFERAQRLGGLIATERIEGFTIDQGPDSILVQKPAGLELALELGLAERLIPTSPPRTAYVLRDGRLHPLPETSVFGIPTRLGPLLSTGLFSMAGKLRLGCEVLVPRRTSPADESIGSFVRRRFGTEAVAYIAEPLLAGIHSGDVNRLSVHALFPRLVTAEQEHASVIRAFRAQRGARPVDGLFRSFRAGLVELVDALVPRLSSDRLRTGVAVDALVRTPDGYAVHLETGESVPASAVLLAIPAFVAGRLVDRLDPELAARCREIPYVSTATVALAYPRQAVAHPLDGSGFVVPRAEPGRRIFACTWISSKWVNRAPAGSVLMRAFFGGARDPAVLEGTDDDLVGAARTELAGLLGISSPPTVTRVYRWPDATPQYEVGHLARLSGIERRLGMSPGLFVTGSGFRAIGIPDCIADGRAQASSIAAFLNVASQEGNGA